MPPRQPPKPDPLIQAVVEWVKSAPAPIQQLIAQQTASVTPAKKAKADVNYRPADDPEAESCAACAHYDGTNGCAVVSGHIDPEHVSDLFTPASQPTAVAPESDDGSVPGPDTPSDGEPPEPPG